MPPPAVSYLLDAQRPRRLWLIPMLSVIGGSFLALLPISAPIPVLPSVGLLLLLGWRLLRPELWQAWIALPLGFADDLIGGAPLGSAATLWTIVLIALDIVDHRLVWRDPTTDWGMACCAIGFVSLGSWALSWFAGGSGPIWTALLPALLGILCYPLGARLCALLDRARLRARRA